MAGHSSADGIGSTTEPACRHRDSVGEVETPDDVSRHRTWATPSDLTAHRRQSMTFGFQDVGHEALADRDPLSPVHVVTTRSVEAVSPSGSGGSREARARPSAESCSPRGRLAKVDSGETEESSLRDRVQIDVLSQSEVTAVDLRDLTAVVARVFF